MPISTKLFGDDVTKDIRNCDTGVSIAKENYPNNFRPYTARGPFRVGGYSRGSQGSFRF